MEITRLLSGAFDNTFSEIQSLVADKRIITAVAAIALAALAACLLIYGAIQLSRRYFNQQVKKPVSAPVLEAAPEKKSEKTEPASSSVLPPLPVSPDKVNDPVITTPPAPDPELKEPESDKRLPPLPPPISPDKVSDPVIATPSTPEPELKKSEPEKILPPPPTETSVPTTALPASESKDAEVKVDVPTPKEMEKEVKPIKDPKQRNVLLVGRSRSGKSTLLSVLKDICHLVKTGSLFYSTKKPVLHQFELCGYQFKVLDTPGLNEQVEIGKEARSTEELVKLIMEKAQECFGGKGFENVDVAITTATFDAGIKPDDIATLEEFLPRLPKMAKKIFVVTRADEQTEDWQQSIKEQLVEYAPLEKLLTEYYGYDAEKNKDVVQFSGSLKREHIDEIHAIKPKEEIKEPPTTKRLRGRNRTHNRYENDQDLQRDIMKIHSNRESLIQLLLPAKEESEKKDLRLDVTYDKIEHFIDQHFPPAPKTEAT